MHTQVLRIINQLSTYPYDLAFYFDRAERPGTPYGSSHLYVSTGEHTVGMGLVDAHALAAWLKAMADETI